MYFFRSSFVHQKRTVVPLFLVLPCAYTMLTHQRTEGTCVAVLACLTERALSPTAPVISFGGHSKVWSNILFPFSMDGHTRAQTNRRCNSRSTTQGERKKPSFSSYPCIFQQWGAPPPPFRFAMCTSTSNNAGVWTRSCTGCWSRTVFVKDRVFLRRARVAQRGKRPRNSSYETGAFSRAIHF